VTNAQKRNIRNKEIVQLYQNGVSAKSIAKKYNIAPGSVSRILRNKGIYSKESLSKVLFEKYARTIKAEYESGIYTRSALAAKYEVGIGVIKEVLCRLDVKEPDRRIYMVNDNYFKNMNKDSAYILGLLIADGHVDYNENEIVIVQTLGNHEVLERVSKVINSNRPLSYFQPKRREDGVLPNPHYRLRIRSKIMIKDLMNLGVLSRKSLTTYFPENIDHEYHPDVIRGLIDGDGWISSTTKEIGLCGNKELLFQVRDILTQELSIFFHFREKKNGISEIWIRKTESLQKLSRYLYQNANIFIPRKFELVKQYL